MKEDLGPCTDDLNRTLSSKWQKKKFWVTDKKDKVEGRHITLSLSDRKKCFGKTQNGRREDIRSVLRGLFIAKDASEVFSSFFRCKVLTSCGPN